MRFESWVHPAGVVMGSRWLVVPTPTAESLLRLRGRASLCMPSRAVLVSVSSARHLPSWCLLWLYSKDEWSDIRTDRQVKRPAESRRFRTAVNQPKPHRDSNAPVQARVHFCIQWTDLHMYNFSVCVQPSVEKQLEKYISLRVQCFVQLEIFLSAWAVGREKNLPMRDTLHQNQSNHSMSHITRQWEAAMIHESLLCALVCRIPRRTHSNLLYCSFRERGFKARWRLFRNASQKGLTTFPDRRASPSNTSVSSVRSPATKSPISSTTWNTTCVKTPSPWCHRKMGKRPDSSRRQQRESPSNLKSARAHCLQVRTVPRSSKLRRTKMRA